MWGDPKESAWADRIGHDYEDWQTELVRRDEERIQRARMDEYREPEDETASQPERKENVHD